MLITDSLFMNLIQMVFLLTILIKQYFQSLQTPQYILYCDRAVWDV